MQILTQSVEVDCQQVWKELTNYIEGDLTPSMRDGIKRHLEGCKRCMAIHDGAKNIVRLLGDDRSIEFPHGFSERLFGRLMVHAREQR